MAKKNVDNNNSNCSKQQIVDRAPRTSSGLKSATKPSNSVSCSPINNNKTATVLSTPRPARGSSQGSSPRTSPGLIAGHYAGCKWTEPPLPSTLPLPPQHWMKTVAMLPFRQPLLASDVHGHVDIASQLKVLLKVQA